MSRSDDRRESSAGFTLVDVAVACFLILLLAAAGLEVAGGVAARLRLESGCTAFVGALERARDLAVSRNGSYEVRVRPDGRAFAVAPVGLAAERALWRLLPSGVAFRRVPRRPLAFHSRGSAAPSGSFSMASGSAEMRVVVAVSGRIRWERAA